MCEERRAARPLETNGRRLVPDNVVGTETANQHDHVDRINRAIHAATEDRANIVSRAEPQRHFDAYLVPVAGDIVYMLTGAPIGGKEIEAPTADTRAPRLRHGQSLPFQTCRNPTQARGCNSTTSTLSSVVTPPTLSRTCTGTVKRD